MVDYLLRGQYERYDDAFERRDQLADLAAAVFVAFQSGEVDYGSLISRLPALVRGRHLMVYSAEPTAHQAWKRLGVAGAVESGQVGIFLHNLGGSKLDPYLDVDVQVDDTVADGVRTVRLGVSVTNTVGDADALADYVAGPWEFVGVPRRGSYSGRLVVYAPGSASELRFVPERTLEAFGRDGAVALMASRFVLEPGDSSPFTVEFEIPAHVSTVEVLPSARFPAVVWRHGDRSETDQAPLLLEFE